MMTNQMRLRGRPQRIYRQKYQVLNYLHYRIKIFHLQMLL
jgi:hypothetical protein